ncbi:MAG: hypothetical protein AAF493_08450 [Pseudomonadota bacterium]
MPQTTGIRIVEKILSAWTPETLAHRIREGERFLEELRREPSWMSEILEADLERKRGWLRRLEA